MKPTIGRIVLLALSEQNAEAINRRRSDAQTNMNWHTENKTGSQVHVGNPVAEGDVYPMVITRVWGDAEGSAVNGQVLLDGTDVFWAVSVIEGDGPGTFSWPQISK